MLMALHSMCQPGRPSPQGLGQNDFAILRHARFPKREIGDGFFFVFVAADAFADAHLLEIQLDQLAVLMQPQPRYFSMLK